jgi:hypothetical protein
LDERGLIAAAPAVDVAIAARVDLIIINRFGRAESRGAGLLPSLARAVAEGIPVLTAVREPYVDAWRQFHGGLATDLEPDIDAVVRWCRTTMACGTHGQDDGSDRHLKNKTRRPLAVWERP